MGNAVVRNRMRRRLREALAAVAPTHAKRNHDYVVIARSAAADRAFAELIKDFTLAFARAHAPPPGKPKKPAEQRR